MGGFQSVLIANRGEIACRIIRTAREMGLRTVAVYSDADAGAPHVAMADIAVGIGGTAPAESYLDGAKILAAAREAEAGAIHPGYGFLSENAGFAAAVEAAGLVWVGPPADAIRLMGDKAAAKRRMIEAGVPCVPGYQQDGASDDDLQSAAEAIGFPVMVKAAAGGGGRGMRLVGSAGDLAAALQAARSEAERAFGSGALILERAIERPRHVEIQVFADAHGTTLHLGERDCSVQRRHQKVLEEAPAPGMTPALRDAMGAAAVEAARAVGYRGAGTVEFLLDGDEFYFLEMNTRLQVEHPVTEMVTGLDLVALQFRVAAGAALGLSQEDVRLSGHAIEARLYAEDPAAGFLPQAGRLDAWAPAEGPGVRVDAGVAAGQEISPFYDPMIAKVIAHGPDRETARRRLVGALRDTVIFGPATNRGFLLDLLADAHFAAGQATTAMIAERHPAPAAPVAGPAERAMAGALVVHALRAEAHAASIGVPASLLNWSSGAPVSVEKTLIDGSAEHELSILPAPGERFTVREEETVTEVVVEEVAAPRARLVVDGVQRAVQIRMDADGVVRLVEGGRDFVLRRKLAGRAAAETAADGRRVVAPMHGVLTAVDVGVGDAVVPGQRLAVLEAMKMQHPVEAGTAGTVTAVHAAAGCQVAGGALLVEIEPEG